MPRTGLTNGLGLSIELKPPGTSYLAGDHLIGAVNIKRSAKFEFGHVQLTLCGRTKTKISRNQIKSTKIFRGRRVFFELRYTLYNAEKAGSQTQMGEYSWPFDIKIPISPLAGSGDKYRPEHGFLSTEDGKRTEHKLPPTYYYFAESGLTKAEAYVEYYLKAEVGESPNSISSRVSTIPLTLRAPSISHPSMRIQSRQLPVRIRTLKFLPETTQAKPTKGKRLKGLFKPSPVPQYSFTVKVQCPSAIQLDHPIPISFGISLTPELASPKTTIEIGPEGPPPVRVTSISFLLRSTTQTRAPDIIGYTTSEKHHEFPFPIPRLNRTGEGGIIPTTPTFTDFGTKLEFRVSRTHSLVLNRFKSVQFVQPLTPSFSTYNISLQYAILWTIELECAGETKSVSNHNSPWPCSVLASVKEEDSKWVGKERGTDYDEVKNVALSTANGIAEILGALG